MVEKNISIIQQGKFHWIGSLDNNLDYPTIVEYNDIQGSEIISLNNHEVFQTKSIFDDKFVINKNKKEVIFVFGVHTINEIETLIKLKHPESLIVIIEYNPALFSYALNIKSLQCLANNKVILFVDSEIGNVSPFLQNIFYEFENLKYLSNIRFYLTEYYRNNELIKTKQYITAIRQVIVSIMQSFGNSLEDNLIGLERNLENIPYIAQSKDIGLLKNLAKNLPAIIVAAGPSLNKNIQHLKGVKAIIIAVDTIANRLIQEGITPDFICSIERLPQVYDYFYKDLKIPQHTMLVGPSLLDKRIFEKFTNHTTIIPFRKTVKEAEWIRSLLNISAKSELSIGYSCAHVAFGLANHLGCSPIILVGQDLAYGETEAETHASGTKYDELTSNNPSAVIPELVEGYYGGNVKTTNIWLQFKHWFEQEIIEHNLHVIDATEGGAKIHNTEVATLKDTVNKYCSNNAVNIYEQINSLPKYDIKFNEVNKKIRKELKNYNKVLFLMLEHEKNIEEIVLKKIDIHKQNAVLEEMQTLILVIARQPLLLHNLQSIILQYSLKYHGREQIINEAYIQQEIASQKQLLTPVIFTIQKIIEMLTSTLEAVK